MVVADDDRATRALVARWVQTTGLSVIEAGDGEAALLCVNAHLARVAVVILDVMMPNRDGFGVLGALRADPATHALPVILLTAHATDEPDVLRGIETGAADHMPKPFSGPLLVARVRQLAQQRAAAVRTDWQLRRAQTAATRDPLTGLANRRQFEEVLVAEQAYAKRHQSPAALALLDLDHFKTVNDVFGHQSGDRVLCHFAEIVRATLRVEDHAFRVGGEEFALVLRGTGVQGAELVIARLRAELSRAALILGSDRTSYRIRFSAGVSPLDGEKAVAAVLKEADDALYSAKRSGRNQTAVARV
ncbi:MAG: diguanylate cyclase [Deltaproteobacteria bacterium]|nr:diguanylate cyclase [Deltaproteobacteria bacterium]